jgi:formylglycine-generating enzyme required for sulfatase activity
VEELEAKFAASIVGDKESAGELKRLQEELEETALERAAERRKLERLQSEMAASHAAEREYEEQIEQLQDELAKIAQEKVEERSKLEQLQSEMASNSSGEKKFEELKQSLHKQAASEREAARSELENLKAKVAASSVAEKEFKLQTKQLRDELADLSQVRDEERRRLEKLQAELAANSAGEKESEKQIKLLQKELAGVAKERDEGRAQLKRLQAEMEACSAEPKGSGKLAKKLQLEQEIMSKELERVRSEAKEREAKDEAKITYLSEELEGLRTQMIQLSAIEKDTKPGAAKDELKALRTELDFVRSQAAADMAILQERLAKAEASADTGKVVEREAVRQDIERLEGAIKQQQKQVKQADAERQKLEDALEERDAKIDQLQHDLEDAQGEVEEAGHGRKEAEQARAQVEAVLYTLKQEVEEESVARERIDAHFKHSGKALDLSDITGKRISLKSIMLGVVVGIGLLFLLLEGFMILSGKGELITALRASSLSAVEQAADVMVVDSIDRRGGSSTTSSNQPAVAEQPGKRQKSRGVVTGTVLPGVDIGPAMLMIAGGEFTMGSDRNQISPDERPAHKVVLQDFAISRNEVTFEEYDRFAEASGRPLPDDNGWGRGKRPVINVNWADASAYARWLSARTGKRYRLPTEAEWEYAAAGGSDSVYWWGYEFEKGRANCFDCGSGWDQKSTAPVGRFGPNGFGLHDTAGNVREWVRDCYHGSYTGAPVDGSAWEESGCKERVVRGGAYDKPAESMRSTWRGHLKADTRLPMIGFRLVREL